MMRKVIRFLSGVFALLLITGCATMQTYNELVKDAQEFERQGRYEEAYISYKQAYEKNPLAIDIKRKLPVLANTISENSTNEGIQAFDNKKYKTAMILFNKALEYNRENVRAANYRSKAQTAHNAVTQKYSEAEKLASKNNWVEAIQLLKEIAYASDIYPNLSAKLDNWLIQGNVYYLKAGREARQRGDYKTSLRHIEIAENLRSDEASRTELTLAEQYVTADEHYEKAKRSADQNRVEAAMEELILAREIAPDHIGANRLSQQLIPMWSSGVFDQGRRYMEAQQHEKAFLAFKKLYENNPQYPGAKENYDSAKSAYMKENYVDLVNAYTNSDFRLIAKYSQDIMRVDPDFLDTKELSTRVLIKGFNAFYQKGLYYMKNRSYGMAILCFRSAEQQLAETQLTQKLIEQARQKIQEDSALNAAFADFHQQVGDPTMSKYAADRLKELLKSRIESRKFKNVTVKFESVQEKETIRSSLPRAIDWETLQARGYNSAIVGNLNLAKLDKSINMEWKIRTHKEYGFKKNPEYERLVLRKLELQQALEGDNVSWTRKNEIKAELRQIDKALSGIPPVIEGMIEKKESYQETTHTWTAQVQLDLHVEGPDGGKIWPSKPYEDVYQEKYTIIPPDLHSDDSEQREVKGLKLPSESEFMRQAIDKLIENQIYPDIVRNLEDYGMRFYDRATRLSPPGEKPTSDSIEILDSIEDYYRFLACHEDKDEHIKLARQVQQHLDSCLSELWLIH